jgi:hypothetical protein
MPLIINDNAMAAAANAWPTAIEGALLLQIMIV